MPVKPHKWNSKEIDFVRNNYRRLSTDEIAKHLNVTYDQARSLIRKEKLLRSEKEIRRLQQIGGHYSKRSGNVSK